MDPCVNGGDAIEEFTYGIIREQWELALGEGKTELDKLRLGLYTHYLKIAALKDHLTSRGALESCLIFSLLTKISFHDGLHTALEHCKSEMARKGSIDENTSNMINYQTEELSK